MLNLHFVFVSNTSKLEPPFPSQYKHFISKLFVSLLISFFCFLISKHLHHVKKKIQTAERLKRFFSRVDNIRTARKDKPNKQSVGYADTFHGYLPNIRDRVCKIAGATALRRHQGNFRFFFFITTNVNSC